MVPDVSGPLDMPLGSSCLPLLWMVCVSQLRVWSVTPGNVSLQGQRRGCSIALRAAGPRFCAIHHCPGQREGIAWPCPQRGGEQATHTGDLALPGLETVPAQRVRTQIYTHTPPPSHYLRGSCLPAWGYSHRLEAHPALSLPGTPWIHSPPRAPAH